MPSALCVHTTTLTQIMSYYEYLFHGNFLTQNSQLQTSKRKEKKKKKRKKRKKKTPRVISLSRQQTNQLYLILLMDSNN
jgi:hypothetical protein